MIYNSKSVAGRYDAAIKDAEHRLSSLDVAKGRLINIKGLIGWVFEQTIRTCLEEELLAKGITTEINEQVPIGCRARVDLKVGSVVIEIKAAGFFNDAEGERYRGYRERVESKGWHYLYLTRRETCRAYVQLAQNAFGNDKAFFLDDEGSWNSFVSTVIRLSQE